MKIIYVYLFIQQHPIFGNHMFSERLFDQWWPPGLNENILTFNITFHVLNQKDQEDNGKEEVNLYKIGVCKVGEEDGCVYQDKDDKMVMTVIFLVLEWIPKKGDIFQGSPKVGIGNGRGSVPGLSLLPFNPSILPEIWFIISHLPYQVQYAIYGFWCHGRLDMAALWFHIIGVGRGSKKKTPPSLSWRLGLSLVTIRQLI